MIKVICLLTGGALGTCMRYLVSTWVQRYTFHSFPLGILSVNVLGSFLIGFCWSLAETFNLSVNVRAFLFVGIYGGFTTFSSFALDTATLFRTGEYKLAFINILANNLIGIIAVFLGLMLGKNMSYLIKG